MKTIPSKACSDERGSVLVIALLMLVFLTMIGISATTTTQIEIQIARNDAFHKEAFFNADSGVYATPKIVRKTMDDGVKPSYTGALITELSSGSFFRQLMGYDAYDPVNHGVTIRDSTDTTNIYANVDVQRVGQQSLAGGGAEFAAGAEGVGVGSTGGVAIIYGMDSLGAGPAGSQSNILGQYRYLPGVAGGL